MRRGVPHAASQLLVPCFLSFFLRRRETRESLFDVPTSLEVSRVRDLAESYFRLCLWR